MPQLAAWSGIVLKLAVVLMVAYAGLVALVYLRQRDLMYLPAATRVSPADTDFMLEHDGLRLHGWRLNPGKPRAILYFGGNAEAVEYNRDDFARWFAGSTVYLLPYRGYAANPGTPEERGLYRDALALYDHVRREQPDAPISVVGRSLGSGVASYVAAHRPVSRLALVTPFDSMANVAQAHFPWLPVRMLLKDRYDVVAHLADYRGPLLVVYAGRDEVVPAACTQRLLAALAERPQLLELPQAGHNTVQDYPAYGETLAGFLQ